MILEYDSGMTYIEISSLFQYGFHQRVAIRIGIVPILVVDVLLALLIGLVDGSVRALINEVVLIAIIIE